MTNRDRETLLQLAKLLGVSPYRKNITVPTEVLAGIARTLQSIAIKKDRPTSEARRQMWTDPSSRHMAIYHSNACHC